MRAVIKAEYLKEFINIAYSCSNEIRLNISQEAITFSVVDVSNAMLLNMDIKPSIFEMRDIAAPIVACIDIAKIRSFVGIFKGFVEIDIGDYISFKNLKYTFIEPLLKSENVKKSPNVPDIEFISKSIIKVSDFRTFIKAYKKDFDRLWMGAGTSEFCAYNSKNELTRMYIEPSCISNSEDHRSQFSIEYISDALSALKGDVDIELSDAHPCKISFSAIDGYASGFFIIAPRIPGDE